MKRRRTIRLRRSHSVTLVVLLFGAVLCSLATIAASDDLVRTTSATNIPGVLLTTWLLAAIFQARK